MGILSVVFGISGSDSWPSGQLLWLVVPQSSVGIEAAILRKPTSYSHSGSIIVSGIGSFVK